MCDAQVVSRAHHGKDDCPVVPPHVASYKYPAVNAESDESHSERSESPGDTGQGSVSVYVPAWGRGSGIHGANRLFIKATQSIKEM